MSSCPILPARDTGLVGGDFHDLFAVEPGRWDGDLLGIWPEIHVSNAAVIQSATLRSSTPTA